VRLPRMTFLTLANSTGAPWTASRPLVIAATTEHTSPAIRLEPLCTHRDGLRVGMSVDGHICSQSSESTGVSNTFSIFCAGGSEYILSTVFVKGLHYHLSASFCIL
jgi:hypothetical protein